MKTDEILIAYDRLRKLVDASFVTCESNGTVNHYRVIIKTTTLEEAQDLHSLLLGLPVKETP
jgi:hypothetical protein